jgi:hypothetical protein
MTDKIKSVTYGLGGYDESKPDNNIVEILYYTEEELAKLQADEEAKAEAEAAEQQKFNDAVAQAVAAALAALQAPQE